MTNTATFIFISVLLVLSIALVFFFLWAIFSNLEDIQKYNRLIKEIEDNKLTFLEDDVLVIKNMRKRAYAWVITNICFLIANVGNVINSAIWLSNILA